MLKELVAKSRSFRRFDESVEISHETLVELVDLARHSPSASNLQGLKFYLANAKPQTDLIFATLKFGGYLREWGGPAAGERPAAYILILGDDRIKKQFDTDTGIAAQTMRLGAAEKGLGGCMVSAVKREELADALELPAYFEIVLVLALGKPAETVVIEDLGEEKDIKYYRDAQDVHHVPKRSLDELIVDPSQWS
ncbi:MAG: nitroreductase family protein [Anaerolineaceae bacterium]